eukprot:2206227-Alexandrium_andersonii.AAC.1
MEPLLGELAADFPRVTCDGLLAQLADLPRVGLAAQMVIRAAPVAADAVARVEPRATPDSPTEHG